MNESLQTFASPVALLIGATLFAILFSVILTALRRAEVFPPGAGLMLAICSSLLAVIGIMRTFGHVQEPTGSSDSSWMDTLLLPYTAMRIAMLLVLLLIFLRKVVSGADKVPRPPKRQIRADSPSSADAEYEHGHSNSRSRLAKK